MKLLTDRKALAENYLHSLTEGHDPKRIEIVASEIDRAGFWEEEVEWRIRTYVTSRIEPFEHKGKRWYRVIIKNGIDATFVSPTITRAVHYLGILRSLTFDLFYTHGWSSWAEKGRLNAGPYEV